MKYLLLTSILLTSFQSIAYESSDAFVIRLYHDKVKVLSPKKWDPKLNVIIENKTLVQVIGKVVNIDGEVLSRVSILPAKVHSVELKAKKGTRLFFIPLIPSFQKVELKLGSRPYEIPPKNKN